MKSKPRYWIKGAVGKPGMLHRNLGIPKGEKIPPGRLRAAAKEKGVIGRRARLALTFSHFRKKK